MEEDKSRSLSAFGPPAPVMGIRALDDGSAYLRDSSGEPGVDKDLPLVGVTGNKRRFDVMGRVGRSIIYARGWAGCGPRLESNLHGSSTHLHSASPAFEDLNLVTAPCEGFVSVGEDRLP